MNHILPLLWKFNNILSVKNRITHIQVTQGHAEQVSQQNSKTVHYFPWPKTHCHQQQKKVNVLSKWHKNTKIDKNNSKLLNATATK